MSERIRYTKSADGTQTSVQTFIHSSNGAQYKVVLKDASWSVVDAATSTPALTGEHAQKHKAQIQARAALVSLGIELNTEKRKERTKAPATA